MAGLGPAFMPVPICQRWAVLKKRACSARLPRKMCGGGSSLASAMPNAQSSSHRPAKQPTETSIQPVRCRSGTSPSGSATRWTSGEARRAVRDGRRAGEIDGHAAQADFSLSLP